MENVMIIREVLAGYASRIRIENAVQLQKAKQVRPQQVREEIAKLLNDIDERVNADPKLKARFDTVRVDLPEGV